MQIKRRLLINFYNLLLFQNAIENNCSLQFYSKYFQNKSKLTEFYKAIHPDMLQNAPDNIKMENTRILKILNNYFDAVSQNERSIRCIFRQGLIRCNLQVTTQIREQINQKYQEIKKEFAEKYANPFVTYTNQYETAKKNFLETTTSLKKRSSKKGI
ncbi:unnamed protein product [Paramecium pentaurelia]|uniref:DUF4460 domain-containing protein n=1 Tax=Paramecium pentaurelia TaxID=43138 RepID=A0A8S1UQJ5_9CILI|nr:unnamed protein product [Paramecium pentaurelia]